MLGDEAQAPPVDRSLAKKPPLPLGQLDGRRPADVTAARALAAVDVVRPAADDPQGAAAEALDEKAGHKPSIDVWASFQCPRTGEARLKALEIGHTSAVKRLALAAAVLAVVAFSGLGSAASQPPTLLVLTRQPLVVRGLHFQANEWVRLAAFSNGVTSKRVHASSIGTFTTALPLLRYGRCNGLGIRAVGSLGSRATLGLKLPLPACAIAGPVTAPTRSP
jgi:hypothetical protein